MELFAKFRAANGGFLEVSSSRVDGREMQRRVLGFLYWTWHSLVSFQRPGEVGARAAGIPCSSRVDCRNHSREPITVLLCNRGRAATSTQSTPPCFPITTEACGLHSAPTMPPRRGQHLQHSGHGRSWHREQALVRPRPPEVWVRTPEERYGQWNGSEA